MLQYNLEQSLQQADQEPEKESDALWLAQFKQ